MPVDDDPPWLYWALAALLGAVVAGILFLQSCRPWFIAAAFVGLLQGSIVGRFNGARSPMGFVARVLAWGAVLAAPLLVVRTWGGPVLVGLCAYCSAYAFGCGVRLHGG